MRTHTPPGHGHDTRRTSKTHRHRVYFRPIRPLCFRTRRVFTGYSPGTRRVLTGYSQGTRRKLAGYSPGTMRAVRTSSRVDQRELAERPSVRQHLHTQLARGDQHLRVPREHPEYPLELRSSLAVIGT